MAVVSVEELFPGRRGSDGIERKLKHTRVFEVITDDPADDETIAGAGVGIPRNGDLHPNNPFAVMVAISADNSDETPLIWLVVCEYDTELPGNQAREAGGYDASGQSQVGGQGSSAGTPGNPLARDDNPLDRPATFRIVWEQTQKIATETVLGGEPEGVDIAWPHGTQICNGVGDPFDPPPMKDTAHPIITIEKNYPIGHSLLALSEQLLWQNAINLGEWRGCPEGTLRIVGMDIVYSVENSIEFGRITFRMKGEVDGHDLVLVNQGFRHVPNAFVSTVPELIDQPLGSGAYPDKATPLKDDHILPPGDPLHYLRFGVYLYKDFDGLGI